MVKKHTNPPKSNSGAIHSIKEDYGMKKKVLALLMTAAMLLSLTACGGGNSGSGDSGTTDSGDTISATASSGDNELTVWCWDPAFNLYAMEEAEKIYQRENPDFKLNIVETPWDDIQIKLTTAATANDLESLPDIFLMQDNAYQKNVMMYPEAFDDLTNSGINFGEFAEAKTAYSVVDGKNYGVPFDNGAAIAAYRTDILAEAGYTLEDFKDITWEQYIEQGKDILEKTGKPLLSCIAGEPDVLSIILQSASGSFFDDNENVDMVGNDKIVKTFEVYKELVESGVLVEVNSWDEYISTIVDETVAGTINGCWILATIQTAEDQSGNWGVVNIPKINNVDGATNYSNNGGSSWAITSNCKNKELAYDFMNSTFGGSVEFYETILPTSGALGTWLPAGESEVYAEPQPFFADQEIYALITDFATKTPSITTGIYFYEARLASGTALQRIISGGDIHEEIQSAQETVEFQMSE